MMINVSEKIRIFDDIIDIFLKFAMPFFTLNTVAPIFNTKFFNEQNALALITIDISKSLYFISKIALHLYNSDATYE